MSAGQHKATVVLDGKADGLSKASREASTRVGALEATVDKLREELARASQRLDEQTSALERHRQQVRADAEAMRAARAEQREWATAIKRAKSEIAAAEKAQADATRKARAEVAAAEKAQADAVTSAAQRMREAGGRTSTGMEQQASAWSRARGAAADYTMIAGGAFSAMERGARVVMELAERTTAVNNVMGNLPFSIDKARTATHGLVKDMELGAAASTLYSTGVVTNAQDFADLARAAQALGGRVGIDTTRAMESLTAALARGSTEMLDNLGVVLKKEQAEREYAESLGKTRDALTDAEKADAFRKVAMVKIMEAAKGVKVDTESAGAALQRLAVGIDNAQHNALGGARAHVALRKGLQAAAYAFRETGKEVRVYGADAKALREMLRDMNVSTLELAVSNAELGRQLDEVRKEELSRVERLILAREATDENIQQLEYLRSVLGETANRHREVIDASIRSQQEEAAAHQEKRKAIETELRNTQLAIAFLEGKGDEEALLNANLAEEVELRAKLLELEGKSAEAAALRTDLELQAQRAAGQALRRRTGGGGRRKDAEWGLDAVFGDTEAILGRLEQQERRAQVALERSGKGATARFRELHQQLERDREAMEGLHELFARLDAEAQMIGTPFDLESFAAQREGERARRLQDAELTFDAERRHREMLAKQREQSSLSRGGSDAIDPLQQLEEETHARLALLDVQERAANDAMERAVIDNQRDDALHALKMARLDEEIAKRRERLQVVGEMLTEEASLHLDFASATIRAALLEEGSLRRKLGAIAKQNAVEFGLIQGPRELILAAISAASLNPVGAAMHLKNAASSFAFAATMGAIGGATGWGRAGGSTTGASAGFGAGAFGRDGGAAGAGGGYGGGTGTGSRSEIPASPEPRSCNAAGAPAGAPAPAVVYNFSGPVYGDIPKRFMSQHDRQARDLGYSQRRVGSG